MWTRQFAFIFVAWLLSFFVSHAQEKPLNIVLIVADDLGYGDLECYGATDIKTPNIDRLAADGVRFTDFYANGPECTPTRAALLTGRYQQRAGGLECAIGLGNVGRYEEALKLSNAGKLGLPTSMNVLPRILKESGYNTALIGKWHLGNGKEFRPGAHGFDYAIGPLGGAVDYFHHTEPKGIFLGVPMEGEKDLYRNDEPDLRKGYYMTHLIADESVEWINIQNAGTPFFLYVPFTAPHDPFQGPDDYQPTKLGTDTWKKGTRADYISMVEELDEGVGSILDKLDEKGFTENTLVIFISDNGPTKIGSAGPFSGNKGHLFEGGIRVPCLIRWPGKITAGTSSSQTAITMDLTASIAAIVAASTPRPLDGTDIIGHVASGAGNFPRTLFWRKKRGENVVKAVRDSDMKYIYEYDTGKVTEYLFDIGSDPGERDNLIKSSHTSLKKLKTLLRKWEQDVQPERYQK
jgi:arylsulfatase A-like enzyme